ncbi:MAG: type II toxin-antitoxin system RelE/ParE family toxin [Planctomycetaceae bacterium]|nr:type II toxin-antitoxin system RelE/ParE family toxin [Planctomycetaceae bacterium]MDG2389058.1 type II toxin-antitoxin system RelE/ParE family toxin [Planctomycetaceae bacterium]
MSNHSDSKVLLTQRALHDLAEIEDYSIEKWNQRVADEYLDAIEEALNQIKAHPELLQVDPEFHQSLHIYRVRKHLLVCDFLKNSTVVLTVISAVMDIPERLMELQPTFHREVEILQEQLQRVSNQSE